MFTKHRWDVLNIQWHPMDDHPAITTALTAWTGDYWWSSKRYIYFIHKSATALAQETKRETSAAL